MPIFAAFMVAAPEMLAVEAAAATAAEIAAAEAAAAAAAEAAQVAAAEAAATAAAEAAATQAGLTAAEQAAQAGIMEVGGATANAASAPITTAEAVQAAAQQSGIPEVASRGIQGIPDVMSPAQRAYLEASTASVNPGITPGTNALPAYSNNFIDPNTVTNVTAGVPGDISNMGMRYGVDPSIASGPAPSDAMMRAGVDPAFLNGPTPSNAMMRGFTLDPNMAPPMSVIPPAAPPGPSYFQQPAVAPGSGPMTPFEYRLNAPPDTMQSLRVGTNTSGITMPNTTISSVSQTPMAQPPSALENGFTKAMDWADKNPFKASAIGYLGANKLGLFNPSGNGYVEEEYDGPLSRYKLSPDFKGSYANPEDFRPTRSYAMGGGIMGTDSYNIPVGYDDGGNVPEYAKGGSLSDSIERYQQMLDGKPQAALPASRDVGIYYDQDPDTRYQDALTAAQIRQAKVNKRANVDLPGMKRPTPMGQLNLRPLGAKTEAGGSSLDPENAASGGIMHSSLGGYAAGGNPRLLKGPGDGMSDNIPATINGRQPARLADGEFVIPADVVSHLGNGSTEAGAKQLHAMMDKVRRARTGNPKQGKNIKPQKYMPKTRA
jgi:hypothetical protein